MKKLITFALNICIIISMLIPIGTAEGMATQIIANVDKPVSSSGLFRTSVQIEQAYDLTRLEKQGVLILEQSETQAVVLVTEKQLESLARLGFEPQASNDLALLVVSNAEETPWLVSSLKTNLEQSSSIASLNQSSPEKSIDNDVQLKAIISSFSVEQLNGIQALPGVDNDADGLTDTQESWWCTDPGNVDSDGDGVTDGTEVIYIKAWLSNHGSGVPSAGKPFAGWPQNHTGCYDDDYDSVPDMAERWELGLNMNRESTDGDKFDDGQELFGITSYPGYGALPRSEDTFITSSMPGWVDPPGNSPVVAAYPQISFDIIPSTIQVELVTQITSGETFGTGETFGYSTTNSEGTSTGVGKEESHTYSEWQEVGNSLADSVERSNYRSIMQSQSQQYTTEHSIGVSREVEKGGHWDVSGGYELSLATEFSAGVGVSGGISTELLAGNANLGVSAGVEHSFSVGAEYGESWSQRDSVSMQTTYGKTEGYEIGVEEGSSFSIGRVHESSQTIGVGNESTQSSTITRETFQEFAVTNDHQIATSQEWSTATAVDSSHAADLTFAFQLLNRGTDNARQIENILLNVYIEGEKNPITTYAGVLTGESCTQLSVQNLYPGDGFPASGVATQCGLALNLDQLAKIDQGASVRVVVADYSYGDDEQFYENAWGQGVIVEIDDDTWDGDEKIDPYLIPTWGVETYQDILRRYFLVSETVNGDILTIQTPEYDSNHEISSWYDYAVSDRSWWNIYLSDYGEGINTPFRDKIAVPESRILMRFNKDSDQDYFSDRVERELQTNLANASEHPNATLVAGYYEVRQGNEVQVQLALQNFGDYNAFGVEARLVAVDETVSVVNSLVGFGGLVPAGQKVLLSSRILPLELISWNGTSRPATAGHFSGLQDNTFTFTVNKTGEVGITSDLLLNWIDSTGVTGSINIGAGYTPPAKLAVSQGILLGVNSGSVESGNQFSIAAISPRDVFTYTINQEPYTPPVIIVSYNDPSGNKRFSSAVQLSQITDSLAPYFNAMTPAPELQLLSELGFDDSGDNQIVLTLTNPFEQAIDDGHLIIAFAESLSGTIVAWHEIPMDFLPGPNLYTTTWNTSEFLPVYDPTKIYKVKVFATDRQGRVIDLAYAQFSNLGASQPAQISVDSLQWDAGSLFQGEFASTELAYANTGFSTLWVWSGKGEPVSLRPAVTVYKLEPGEMKVVPLSLDTSLLPLGEYNGSLTLRTNDPNNPIINISVTGTIVTPTDTVVTQANALQPLTEDIQINGSQSANTILPYSPADEIAASAEPILFTDGSGTIAGKGEPFLALQPESIFNPNNEAGEIQNAVIDPIGDIIGFNDELIDAVELEEYRTEFSRIYVWPDGRGVAISSEAFQEGGVEHPDDVYQEGALWDGYVNKKYPTIGQFGEVRLYIGNSVTWEKENARTFIRFNLPGLPAYSVIDSATFHLYEYSWCGSGSVGSQVYRVTSYWDETNPRPIWNSQPGIDWGTLWSTLSIPASTGWRDWTITGLTQLWYSGTPNYGLMLRADPETASCRVFYSRENGSLTPHIKVYFHIAPPPNAPTLYTIANSDGDGTYTVDWSDVANTTSYDLQQSFNSGPWTLISNTPSSIYYASGRSAGTWCYSVRANNAYGSSGWSATQCSVVNPPPGTPIINSISNSDGNGDYSVGWNAIPTTSSYELQENYNSGTFSTVYTGISNSFAVTGRTSGQWCYRVKANNASGSSAWSSTQCTIVNLPPNVPVNLLPVNGTSQFGRSVTLSWADGGDGDNYPGTPRQYRVNIGSLTSGWITATQWTTTLPDDGVYSWQVQASDGLSTSSWSGYQNIQVYSIKRTSAEQVHIALPDNVVDSVNYQVRYGLKGEFVTENTEQTIYLELPKRLYSSVTMDMLINSSIPTPTGFELDVAGNGLAEWVEENVIWHEPITYVSPNLADAVNDFMAQSTAVGGEIVLIPIDVVYYSMGDLYLTNVNAVVGVDSDPMLGVGDLTINNIDPMETDIVNITARVRNAGVFTAKNVMVNYFIGNPNDGGKYIGSKLVSNILADGYVDASLAWNTAGYVGSQEIYAVLDYGSQISELDEQNNATLLPVAIRTRPDLAVTSISLSDDEPVFGESITLTLTETNQGESDALPSLISVYDGDPQNGGLLVGESSVEIMRESSTNLDFGWIPDRTGWHRLFVFSDADEQVSEYDESNNQNWLDVYVGLAGPLMLDSGTVLDPVYSIESGYGYVDINQPDELVACGINNLPEETLRRDPDGKILYQFDHLLPGHFYHLDVMLYECDGAGRQESVFVDGNQVAGVEDLGDGQIHRLSLRLDPALYADRNISVAIQADGIDGAVVSSVNLHDIDYRYADAGGNNDPQYPGNKSYGWLDGTPVLTWGTLPYKSVRVDQSDNTLNYEFDNLSAAKLYNVHFTFWQPSGTARIQKVQVDGVDTGLTVNTGDYLKHQEKIAIPPSAYGPDGKVIISIVRTNATTGAMVNEIALEEETIYTNAGCVVQETPYFSETYGSVLVSGVNAPVGSIVQALNPRGDTVGCFTVTDEGLYGFMRIYGEDTSAVPSIPGMRNGEMVSYKVNSAPAVASPLFYWSDDHAAHNINLNAGNISGQSILLQPGWNLISFNVEPPAPIVSSVLQSVNGRYDRVLSESGIYVPSLPDPFNTLRELHSATGYYLRVTGTTSVSLLVEGIAQPCSEPKELHAGWNWIGAPCAVTPTATALQSIDGHYQRVLSLTKTYDPALPAFSTLKNLTPGEGYLIYITDPVTLTYPAGTLLITDDVLEVESACENVLPTPFATLIYGEVRWMGRTAPMGSLVEIVTPRGELAGCGVVEENGTLPLTQVYGADNGSVGGFFDGEELSIRINGIDVEGTFDFVWHDDKSPHWIQPEVVGYSVYLPSVLN